MTKNKFYILLLSVVALSLASCADSFLDRDPAGGTILEEQFQKFDDALEGSLRGLYSSMYEYSAHDEFGQRSIDMYGDLLSGDMALTAKTYGWFYTDEAKQTVTQRSGYMWLYYYGLLHNINSVIRAAETPIDKGEMPINKLIAKYGLPEANELSVLNGSDTVYTYSEKEALLATYYAQALTLRGYVYSGLIRLFAPTTAHVYAQGYNIATYPAFPLYNEVNMDTVQPLAYLKDVYTQVETDLSTAIGCFNAFSTINPRTSKLEADINVARGLLAYSYLNKAYLSNSYDPTMPLVAEPMTLALKYAEDLINEGGYRIISNDKLYTTGFNNVDETSWIWGEKVTVETATGLGSFFGQVDIHSYSYAWSGDTKVIDKNLYDSIPSWDGRKGWFNDGSANATFKLCPDGKFFSAKSPKSTAGDDIDREWLSDNVFMRIESIYLIAAEAAHFLSDDAKALSYLDAILSERLNPDNLDATTEYDAFKLTLSNRTAFEQELYRNWRLEMWGEGYGLQTFRRLSYLYKNMETVDKVRRGSNHLEEANKDMEYTDTYYTMMIPGSETNYNPWMQED